MKVLRISLWVIFLVLLLIVGSIGYFVMSLAPAGEPWQPSIAAAPDVSARSRAPCADNNPYRNAYFGDLHVHTAYSWDGAGRGMNTTPDQAYRFARGENIGLPPYDSEGNGLRNVQLDRPWISQRLLTTPSLSVKSIYVSVPALNVSIPMPAGPFAVKRSTEFCPRQCRQ